MENSFDCCPGSLLPFPFCCGSEKQIQKHQQMDLQRWKITSGKITPYFSDACLPSSCRGTAIWYLCIYEAEVAPTQRRNGAPCCSSVPYMEGRGKGSWLGTALTPQSPFPAHLGHSLLLCSQPCLFSPTSMNKIAVSEHQAITRILPGKWVAIHLHLH